ncbi:MAG: non-canonical purine NTP pyrophosphatase [Patescibacteria group bacterium]
MIDVLFGTTNKTKRDRFQELFKPVGLNILTLSDINIESIAEEKGETPTENAKSKALFYVEKADIPTFAIDYGLYIEKFSDDKQPGLFVRRIHGEDKEVSDEELLDYYVSELEKVGGESPGVWVSAISLAISPDEVYSEEFSEKTFLFLKRIQ